MLGIVGTLAATDLASRIVRTNQYRFLGFDIGAGDLDREGKDDLLMGTLGVEIDTHPLYFKDAGAVFVVYGDGPGAPVTPPEYRVFLPLVLR